MDWCRWYDTAGVHRRAIGEHHGRTKGGTWPRIGSGHDGGHVVSARIQAMDRVPLRVEDARIDVGRESGADCDVCRPDGDRVEWRRRKRADAGVGRVGRVAIETSPYLEQR